MAKLGRPKGTGKPEGEKFIMKAFRFPPELWAAFSRVVPGARAVQDDPGYMEREVRKRGRADGTTD